MIPEVRKASLLLQEKKLENSLWEARVIAAHVLGCDLSDLYLKDGFDSEALEREFFHLVNMRASGTPLQHLTGEWDFWGRTFRVDHRALIPRPETELLVDFVLSSDLPLSPLIVDVGTGSGVIGITLALELPLSVVTATDVSPTALGLAHENAVLLGADNYFPVNCDLFSAIKPPFDVIVANLPYIPSGEVAALPPVVRDYDPVSALDGGVLGVSLIGGLAAVAQSGLRSEGLLVLETGYDQEALVLSMLPDDFWVDIQSHRDFAGNHRMVTAVRR